MLELIEGEKQCSRCSECKPLSMFSKFTCQRGYTQVHSICKSCRSKYQGLQNKRKTKRQNAPPRDVIWPRPGREHVIDVAFNAWRGPVDAAALRWCA